MVDGSTPTNTHRFQVVLFEDAVAQLDELVVTTRTLPDGTQLSHYGIVVEGTGTIEGAEFPSDTHRIAHARTMPGITSRRVEVQVLRTVPELWLPPEPGARVERATGQDREHALFLDQMEKPLPVGIDQSGQPLFADFSFLNGEKGGHVSISGVSGVATKTSYALFLLYMIFQTEAGRHLLGAHAPATRALVFNVKGEDLLHLDRKNSKFDRQPTASQWTQLGVQTPGAFERVRLYAPRSPRSHDGAIAADVSSRAHRDLTVFGWTPWEFVRQGLLRFCFTEEEDGRTQVSFIEQRVRVQLARWAWPLAGATDGAVVLCEPPAHTSYVLSRILEQKRDPRTAGEGAVVENFHDLLDFLTERLSPDDDGLPVDERTWTAKTQPGTVQAFLRRLYAQSSRLGHLITTGVSQVTLDEAINVVDIHALHDSAQRFVVGALLTQMFEAKQGSGREPLRFIVLDELNKYAPRHGSSPIKDVLIDIAARGRSLGVLLIGAQQSAAEVDGNIIRNAAIKIAGRLDAGEAGEYRFLSPELRERAARFLPGTMVLDQPLIPAPVPFRFPFPGFATCVAEGAPSAEALRSAEEDAFGRL
ncbi:MAG: ATP-binding protein [Candidatus Eisenbacteria bacterium]